MGNAGRTDKHSAAVVALFQVGHHLAADVPRASVVNDGLQAVAHFDLVLALLGRQQKQDTAVLFLRTNTELFVEIGSVIFPGAAVEGVYGHDRNLRPCFLLDLGAQRLQLGLGRGINDARKIRDVTLRADIGNLICPCEETAPCYQHCQQYELDARWHRASTA